MRIAVWNNLPSGGGKRALYEHVRGLLALGHTVESWCPPTADTTFLPLSSMVEEHVVDLPWPLVSTRMEDFQIRLEMERALAVMDEHCRRCAEQINRGGFDVVLANSCSLFAVSPIGRHVVAPAAIYLQEPYRRIYEALPTLPWRARPSGATSLLRPSSWRPAFKDWRNVRNLRVRVRAEADNARSYKMILANSYFSRESILRAYGLNSEVCYLGVDAGLFADLGMPREDLVVCLGSIASQKNAALVVRALAAVRGRRPRLVWIGNMVNEVYRDQMLELAGLLGVEVEFVHHAPQAQVVEMLNKAMAMVYTPRLEPFGLAPLEANACATPVISILEGGMRETIRHEVNGLLADPHPTALASAVERLRDDPALARRLGREGRRLVETEWSVAAAAGRLERRLAEMTGMLSASSRPQAPEVSFA